jgi:glycerophosphoryl diester phosphodiesterase
VGEHEPAVTQAQHVELDHVDPQVERRLPGQAAKLIRDGGAEALMSHFIIVSPALVRAVHEAGGQLYVWTVDDPKRIAWLESIGVDGVITNDPRLFG